MHTPKNRSDLPEEDGKILTREEKLILHAVRDGVNTVHNFSQMRNFKTLEIFQKVKKAVSKNLAQSFDEKVEKAIREALRLQIQQYEKISRERFEHRQANGKLERDFHFLLRSVQFLNQWTFDVAKETAGDFLEGIPLTKFDDSDALKAMRLFIQSIRRHMKKKEIRKLIRDSREEYQN